MKKEGIKEIGAGGLETIGAPVSSGTGSGAVVTPDVKYQAYTAASGDTSITDILPEEGEGDVIYRVGSWDGTQVDASKTSEYAWDGSDYTLLRVVDSIGGGVFDVSAYNASGGTLATYADLAAALEDVPDGVKHGGMELCFVRTSDDKYVQYRLTADEFSTDVEDWEQSASVAQLEELEDNVVMTGTYDATVAVGLADNLRGDTVVNAEFYKRKTGGTQSVGSGIATIKEIRGKSIVWNQEFAQLSNSTINNVGTSNIQFGNNEVSFTPVGDALASYINTKFKIQYIAGHKYYLSAYIKKEQAGQVRFRFCGNSMDFWANAKTSYTAYSTIRTCNVTSNTNDNIISGLNDGVRTSIKGLVFVDLTLMFGAGNEPATVAEFEKMFSLDYYDYNAGEVIPFAGQNLVTTGKNQYNPAIGKANLLAGQTYQLLGTHTSAEIDGVAVTLDSNNCFTTTKDCVLDITGGNNTDTFVAIYNGETNTFEPYEKHTLPLDPSQWRDKNGNLVFPYGGMHGVGGVYDYAKVDADGYIRKANLVYGGIDLGNYDYTKQENLYTTSGFVPPKANMLFGIGKSIVWNQLVKTFANADLKPSNQSIVYTDNGFTWENATAYTPFRFNIGLSNRAGHKLYTHIFSEKTIYLEYGVVQRQVNSGVSKFIYTVPTPTIISNVSVFNIEAQTNVDVHDFFIIDLTQMFGAGNEPTVEEFEAMFPLDYYDYNAGSLGILANQTYADAAAFKAAMQGVPLYYELATPVEVELATPIYAKYLVDKDGTEEITPANGTTPYTTMANLSILYAMDARGEIKNLPKNYLSKESAENMLNAMVTAGVIASYTMTWDAANSRYAFTFVKAEEAQTNQVNNESNI